MRRRHEDGMARGAGLRSALACGVLLAQGQLASAQNSPSSAGDAPTVPRSSSIQGRDAASIAKAAAGQNSRLLIAHGLEMAIEGSTLQRLAPPSQATGPASTALRTAPVGIPTERPDTPGRTAGVGAGAVAPSIGSRSTPAVGGPSAGPISTPTVGGAVVPTPSGVRPAGPAISGTVISGAPGETVSGRPVGAGPIASELNVPGATGRTAPGGAAPAPAPGATPPGAMPMGPGSGDALMAGGPSAALQLLAQRSFDAGDRLLGQVGQGPDADMRLQQAAIRYAATLRSLGSLPAGPGQLTPADVASVALINHGVKEAIGSMRIGQVSRMMGPANSPAAQVLLSHAREMDAEIRSAIRPFAPGPNAPGTPGPMVQALAQQAGELVMAMQGENGEAGAPPR